MTGRPSSREAPSSPIRKHVGSTGGGDREPRLTDVPRLARAASIGLSGLTVVLVLLLGVTLGQGGKLVLITRPLSMQVALALPYLIAVFASGTSVSAVLAWWHRYWSLPARIHQTILAVLGLGFTWQLAELGLLAL